MRSSSTSRSSKKPVSRSCTRTTVNECSGWTYAIPSRRSERATDCETSFVMSITDSVGRAAAIEYGTSTVVIQLPHNKRPQARLSSCPCNLPRQAEVDVLTRHGDLLERVVAGRGEPVGGRSDELLGRRGAGGQPDRRVTVEQLGVERALAVDEVRLSTGRLRHLDEALRIRAVLGADDEDERRAERHHLFHRVLPVLRRVEDVVRVRPAERAAHVVGERVDDRRDVVERQGRLRDHGDGLVGRQRARLLRRLDDDGRPRTLAERPDHLDVIRVSDERDEMSAVGVGARLGVHLVHERARRVDDLQAARLGVRLHRRRDAVRGENADLAFGNLGLVLDEHRTELLEAPHDVLVVHDLVADVHGWPVLLEQALDDLDRAVDAGAERARSGEENLHASAFSSELSARSASRIERTAAARFVTIQRRRPTTFMLPSGCTVESTPWTSLSTPSEMARTMPARRPLRASIPLSMSTASAPLASCSRRRSEASWTSTSEASTVPGSAPRTPRPVPSHRVAPLSSTTRVASSTSPTRRSSRSAPATPNETSEPSGSPAAPRTPMRTVRKPRRRATRSSAVVATA